MTTKALSHFTSYGAHYLDDDDKQAVMDALDSDFLTGGARVKEFEEALCKRVHSKYAVSCANGTAGLHIASMALDIQKGDKVIVPTITFLATANAPHFCGADIFFADVDPDTALMTPETFQAAIDAADGVIKAVFPVHIAGHVCDMKGISRIAKANNIAVIEDACHAFGSDYDGAPVGNCAYSDMTMFSFHPVKNIAMGEGGCVTTNNSELVDKLMSYRSHGLVRDPRQKNDPWLYEMHLPGLNYRLTDIQCALGISQLKKLDSFKAHRAKLRQIYSDLIAPHQEFLTLMPTAADSNPCWHLCVVKIDFENLGVSRGDVMNRLAEVNVGTQVHYIPVHSQPYYKSIRKFELKFADQYYQNALTLPLHMKIDEDDVVTIVENLVRVLKSGC